MFLVLLFASPLIKEGITKEAQIMTFPSRNISISINRGHDEVYRYISDPQNLPDWASGLAGSTLIKEGDQWISNSPMGKVKVKFCPQNSFGVVDHDVTLPSGEVNHNPLRVAKNNSGSEVIFTLYRRPGVTDKGFEKDYQTIEQDLRKLKGILEK